MTLRSTTFRRVFAASLLAVAFIVMASVFSPDRTKAEYGSGGRAVNLDSLGSELQPQSVDAHEGLPSLGSIETNSHIVQIYSTDAGPRYSVYDRITRRELGTLLTPEQVSQSFPELRLLDSDFFAPGDDADGMGGPLMLADPIATFE